ncbi:hypothetical protein K469DRAFT_686585 [Zopfia rhizophila CBS 207.26]|uniref:Zn(2)-C6 fungal-type domain-containing protein n=1 Tax=Zopfia rhizophila CBS 207.26 TaxID=1314779 RepID=A0A6A6ESN3_9PEZI|nr:hypothetical protein K469DRAFT_686585 [Zopfia rhizophila CBS 207.26]
MEKMKSRKPHTKSRNGCLPCKTRHVKCDETKPACVNCDTYGKICEYAPPKTKIAINNHVSPYPPVSTPSSTEGGALSQSSPHSGLNPSQDFTLNILDLRLLHHWSTVTALSLNFDPEAQEVLRSYFVKIGFDHPYLLHGILALAALHLSRLDQSLSSDYLLQAARHHDAALNQFRAAVQELDHSNFEAVFSFAFILFPYSCGLPVDLESGAEHVLGGEVQHLSLVRMVRPMVKQFYIPMFETELGHLVPRDTQGIDFERTPSGTGLENLQRFFRATRHLHTPDINEAYYNAIHPLEILFETASHGPDPPSASLVKMWPHEISQQFLDLLSERQPGALIIFAHYGVLLSRTRHFGSWRGVRRGYFRSHRRYWMTNGEPGWIGLRSK